MMNLTILCAVVIGFVLDCLFGDPHWLPHPICLIGNAYAKAEKWMRRLFPKTHKGAFWGGALLCSVVVIGSWAVPWMLLFWAGKVSTWLAFGLQCLFCYQIFAARSLREESMKVYRPLVEQDVGTARKYLGYIVGRDTQQLDGEQITQATVETIAENTSDGVIAPMLFMLIGGAPLGFLYKAINTADSMFGYKNEQYLDFGRFCAKLDDVANYIPARLSGLIMIIATFLVGFNTRNAAKIYWRDRKNHSSPNSAQTESVCAGALGVQLAGDAYYFGKLVHKKTIGDTNRPIEAEDIKRANRLMYSTSIVCLLLFCAVKWLICFMM